MKNNILKEKKNLLIIGAIIAVIIIAIILICFVFKKDKGMTTETLESRLEKVGIDFYENHYYSGINEEEREEKLSYFKDNGIKVDITNVELLVTIDQEVKEQLDKDNCDPDETKITIYPKEPYGQKDYTVKVDLVCEK